MIPKYTLAFRNSKILPGVYPGFMKFFSQTEYGGDEIVLFFAYRFLLLTGRAFPDRPENTDNDGSYGKK